MAYVVRFKGEVIGRFTKFELAAKSVTLTWSKFAIEWSNENFLIPGVGEGRIDFERVEVEVLDRVEHM